MKKIMLLIVAFTMNCSIIKPNDPLSKSHIEEILTHYQTIIKNPRKFGHKFPVNLKKEDLDFNLFLEKKNYKQKKRVAFKIKIKLSQKNICEDGRHYSLGSDCETAIKVLLMWEVFLRSFKNKTLKEKYQKLSNNILEFLAEALFYHNKGLFLSIKSEKNSPEIFNLFIESKNIIAT